jgi:hypothetical protein
VPDEYGIKGYPDWVGKLGDILAYGSSETPAWRTQEIWRMNEMGKRPTTPLYKFLLWIDKFRQRKVIVQIDPWDSWGVDSTLNPIILPLLKQLKSTTHSSCGDMPAFSQTSNCSQYCFDFYEEGDELAWKVGHKQWEETLDKMIWSFEQLQTDWDDQFHTGESDIYFVREENGCSRVERGPNDTRKFDAEGHKKHAERIQEGLELFGKHYTSLWD